MIRSFLVVLALVLFLLTMLPLMLFLMVFRLFNPKKAGRIAQNMIAGIFRIMFFLAGTKVEVLGRDRIPVEGGVLFVSNHRSYFDILTGFTYTPKLMGFVAKQQMGYFPLVKQWMDVANCLFLDRKDIKNGMRTIQAAVDKVRDGVSIWICPEGGRTYTHGLTEVKEFKEGSLKIAQKGNVPVVPVAILNTEAIYERQRPRIRPAKIVVEYGEPIYLDRLEEAWKKRASAYAREEIIRMLTRNRELLEKGR